MRKRVTLIAVGGLLAAVLGITAGGGGYSLFSAQAAKSQTDAAGNVAINLSQPGGATFTATVDNLAPGDFIEREITIDNTSSIGLSVVSLGATSSACTLGGTATPCTSTPMIAGDTGGTSPSPGMQVVATTCPGGTITATEIGSTGEYAFTCSTTWSPVLGAIPSVSTPQATSADPNPIPYVSVPSSGSVGILAYSGTPTTTGLETSSGVPNFMAFSLPLAKNAEGTPEMIPAGGTVTMILTMYVPSTAGNRFENNSATITYTFDAVQRAGEPK